MMRLKENDEIDREISRVKYVCKELPMPHILIWSLDQQAKQFNLLALPNGEECKLKSLRPCCMLSGSPCQSGNLMNYEVAFLSLTCTQHKMALMCGYSGIYIYISHDVERRGKKRRFVCLA